MQNWESRWALFGCLSKCSKRERDGCVLRQKVPARSTYVGVLQIFTARDLGLGAMFDGLQ